MIIWEEEVLVCIECHILVIQILDIIDNLEQTWLFSLDMGTSLGKGKLWLYMIRREIITVYTWRIYKTNLINKHYILC